MKHYTKEEWGREQYKGKWQPTRWNLDCVVAGEIPAEYIGKRNVLIGGVSGTTLITEGFHFTVAE